MREPGFGVLIAALGDNGADLLGPLVGKKIVKLKLDDNSIHLEVEGADPVKIYDNGQSCCEARYITTDDNLDVFVGSEFRGVDQKEYQEGTEGEWGNVHDKCFFEILTSMGPAVFVTHVEHNGYYGGFSMQVTQ